MIETERLILRPHSIADFEALCAMNADPVTRKFVGGGVPIPREECWHRLMRYAGHWAFFGYGMFAIIEKDSGRFVGETGLADFHRGLGEAFDPFPEAGWMLSSTVFGKGYATEAVTAAHRWFEANRPEARTVCIIDPGNTASVKVAEKLGYRPFGETRYKDAPVTMYERLRG